jgi:hypothetical protein
MGILNNLTADNRTNKSLFVKLNGVQTLMQKLMMDADGNDDFIEVAVSSIFGNEIQSFFFGGEFSCAHFDILLLVMILKMKLEK